MDDLKGKVAIVTGAGGRRGIGKAISIRLAQKGVKVVVSDVVEIPYLDGDWKGVNSVVEEIKISGDQRNIMWASNGRKIMTVPFDENPYSALAAWFKTDEGMEVHKTITKRLK